ncbi:MAG: hypothetical protein GX079_01510 [Tissierellia bacterium]|nr:hypothetical protein [Tissierellia bacterium]
MEINKKALALVALIIIAFVIIIWPTKKIEGPSLYEPGHNIIEEGKAESQTSQVETEVLEDFEGVYSGRIELSSIELVARTFLAKIPVALAKSELEDSLKDGFPVDFILEEDGSWELDLGRAFSQYQITSIISTSEDRIKKEDGILAANRSFYIPDLDDYLYLRLNGNLLDKLEGTFILEGENKNMKLAVIGSYKLIKN